MKGRTHMEPGPGRSGSRRRRVVGSDVVVKPPKPPPPRSQAYSERPASLSSRVTATLGRVLMRGLFDSDSSDDDRDAAETARSSKPTSSDGYEFLDNPHTSEDVLAHEAGSGQGTPFIFPTHPKHPRSSSKDAHKKRPGSFARLEIGSEENAVSKTFILLRPFKAMSAMRNNLKEDFGSILLLLFLYLLQGIPLGLISAVPILLQSKHVTYTQQALFSFAFWPFSLKLLWAPIVDSLYFQRIGRRKSWMVPCQYLIGAGLLYISYFSPYAVGDGAAKVEGAEEKAPNVLMLMLVFLPLNFLAATQDIAVDGWALTMLSRKNVGYASTCNVVGQTIGYFWGNVGLLTLESKDFCNRFRSVPQEYGFVDLSSFAFFNGWVFIISTTLVFIFKREVDHSVEETTPQQPQANAEGQGQLAAAEGEGDGEMTLGIGQTYVLLYKIMRLKPVMYMAVVLLTAKISFAATDGMTDLKLINLGFKKSTIASRSIFLTPLQIILPWLLGKYTAGKRPLSIFLFAYPYRIIMGVIFAGLLYVTPNFRLEDGEFTYTVYGLWILAYYFQQTSAYCIFLSMMAFNAQVSDPKIGGTYMTLLNTLNNLGGNWPITMFLGITDRFTFKNCIAKGTQTILNTCNTKHDEELCHSSGDVCETSIDGYYVSVAICTVFGFIWYRVFYNRIQYFQRIPREEWRVIKNK